MSGYASFCKRNMLYPCYLYQSVREGPFFSAYAHVGTKIGSVIVFVYRSVYAGLFVSPGVLPVFERK